MIGCTHRCPTVPGPPPQHRSGGASEVRGAARRGAPMNRTRVLSSGQSTAEGVARMNGPAAARRAQHRADVLPVCRADAPQRRDHALRREAAPLVRDAEERVHEADAVRSRRALGGSGRPATRAVDAVAAPLAHRRRPRAGGPRHPAHRRRLGGTDPCRASGGRNLPKPVGYSASGVTSARSRDALCPSPSTRTRCGPPPLPRVGPPPFAPRSIGWRSACARGTCEPSSRDAC